MSLWHCCLQLNKSFEQQAGGVSGGESWVSMWTSCLGHSTACSTAAAAGRDCNRLADLPLPPLTAAVAGESRPTLLTS